MSAKKRKNEETKSAGNDNVQNYVGLQIKLEDIYSNNTDSFQNFQKANYDNQKMDINPNRKKIKRESSASPYFKNLMNKKQEKDRSPQSDDTTQKIMNSNKNCSISSDYDIFKSEVENIENIQNTDNIEFTHDLDAVIYLNNIKMSSDILSSSMMDNSMMENHLQQSDDNMTQMNINKDPLTDPLFISDHEEKNVTPMELKSVSLKKETQKKESACLLNKQDNNVLVKQKYELKKEVKVILKRLEDIEKKERIPFNLIQKLQKLHVKLIHEVPPQHKLEPTGARVPTKEIKKLFRMYGPLRKGVYVPIEDKTIMKNWKMFCKLHDWNVKNFKPFIYWRFDGEYYIRNIKERQKFVQFLANGLPWRSLYSVYTRFKVLHQKEIIKVRYTSKEDKKILMYMENEDLNKRNAKFSELAKLLRRHKSSISRRYQKLKKKLNSNDKSKAKLLKNVIWTLSLIKKFIKTLLNITLSEDINELKCAILPKPIWQKMEKKLHICERTLKRFWQQQLHLQLFSTSPIYLNDIKIQLIEYMYIKGISHTHEIIWPNITRYFEGATPEFLAKIFFDLVQQCDIDMDNIAEIVEFLYHEKIPEFQKMPMDKFLPRIIYENRKIQMLNEDNNVVVTESSIDENDDNDDSDSNT